MQKNKDSDMINKQLHRWKLKKFKKGIKAAVPMTMDRLINVLYNIIDRIYIGRIPGKAPALSPCGLPYCRSLEKRKEIRKETS